MGMLLALAVAQAVVPAVHLPSPSIDPCARFQAIVTKTGQQPRRMTIDDLVATANIGRTSVTPAPTAFGISPDSQSAAWVVKQANPDANAFCQKLVVGPLDGIGEAVEIDRGGQFIRDDFRLNDFQVMMAGWDKPNIPRWSPDGTRIAYLKREAGSTQVWLVDPTRRTAARQATFLADDVDGVAWSSDGTGLVVATRPGIRAAALAIEAEGQRGFLFDKRFGPQFADHPLITRTLEPSYTFIPLGNGNTRPATAAETERLKPALPTGVPRQARLYAAGPDGYAAWLEPKFPDNLVSPTRLVIRGPDNRGIECNSKDCEGIRGLWWLAQPKALVMLQTTGWARSQLALLRWQPGDEAPRQMLVTDDVLIGCQPTANELICEREGTLQPRRLVAIDPRTGRQRIVHDPNPDFGRLRLGKVVRLRQRNAIGIESFADLVLPPDHKPGQKHPLVVVQYRSTGFLRGGTGDEVPVQPLAARGFAVLSFDRPNWLVATVPASSEAEWGKAGRKGWADRQQVQSALEIAVTQAIETGTVDPDRMGISGFSDGSTTVQYALVNSELFKVASMGSCCEDLYSYALTPGPRFAELLRADGYSYFDGEIDASWQKQSLILNVERMKVPILVQASDSEYESGLDVVETLSHHKKPIEMHVFPNEPHVKWQPAHRRALYERNVEWFDFWLMKRRNCSAERNDQYSRWLAMPGAPAADELSCFDASRP